MSGIPDPALVLSGTNEQGDLAYADAKGGRMLLPISGWNWMKQRIQRHDVFRGWLYAALYFLRVMQQNPQKNGRACCFLILTSGTGPGRPATMEDLQALTLIL